MNEILIAKNLAKAFGRVQAVADVSFAVRQGELLGVLGPNGAGKTSMFNLLTGIYMPDDGQIVFEGHDITRMAASKRCSRGLGRTFQIPRPFGDMTVYENVLVGAIFGGGQREKDCKKEVGQILEMTDLWDRRNRVARTLPILGRKRLELARGLATRPKVLLLDEIAGGLTEAEAHEVLDLVKAIQSRGVTIIWIEHIRSMMERVDRLLALAHGCIIMCDKPQSVMGSEKVMECYLGVEHGE
jgi:branched-chain amino acid transport system ATP-binding protein